MSIYSDLIERFAPEGLSSHQQAEIDSIRLATQFDDNDSQWGVILPIYFLSNRREQARVDQEALLRAIQNVTTGGIDAERLGKLIGPHIDASDIDVPAPEVNAAKIAQAITRATLPAFESALADRVVKMDAKEAHEAIRGAVSDTLFSWQVAAAVAAALLVAIAGYWWGGKQVEWRDQPVMQQMQMQIRQLQAEQDRGRR
ncbi:MAG: hypothetical protein J0I24_09445 [Thiomonas arsenitoxydans]|uniref:Uncharacterized protein n=1 Tax=Thiomonas arsenitoxydans (strain DSM 22701 / CIP 110005 / 3As) TaxID=426114 RepID=A0A8I1SWD2_THIA3|nr:hypothetical protein [Thiomonas arsenitoxydans]MBN8744518.1 hypothetical protein [Thiomonas arsenitoxydans]MDE2255069.1 hypothetical protein [Betaproteobacteria bacterium]